MVSTYKSPQIPEAENLRDLVLKYKGDFRRLYIEHPRVRLDGVYIAVCHYMFVNVRGVEQFCFSADWTI